MGGAVCVRGRWDDVPENSVPKSEAPPDRRGIEMKDKAELDGYEQHVENEIETYVPVDDETRRQVEAISELAKKRKNVNIRISESDLTRV